MAKTPAKRVAQRRIPPAERARIEALFERFEAAESDPRTELDHSSPYTLLAAVALSAQATDVSVNKATARLFAVADTPGKILELGEAGIIPYIASIGLFRTKAKNLVAAARILVETHGGEVPLEREALQALPGVGRKTASVVLNELGVEPAIAVDTHVFRVSHRLGLARSKTPDKVEHELM
jgi:endonuclease-3